MKRILFVFFIFFFIMSNFFSKEKEFPEYLKPASVNLGFYFSPFFNLYNPEFKGLYALFATTFDISSSFQYRFGKFIGFESGISLNLGLDFTEANYIENKNLTKYSQTLFSIFLDIPLNAVIYIPIKIELKNNYAINLIIKSGIVLDFWLYSYYKIEKNSILIQEGSFHDSIIDGPNQFQRSVDYSKIINLVNLGLNLSFATKFYSSKFISFYPELGIKAFFLPTLYGYIEKIGGYDLLLSRNDGSNDKTILDFKIQLYVGFFISFDFGKHNDNLYEIVKFK